jgi:hypothetical protein
MIRENVEFCFLSKGWCKKNFAKLQTMSEIHQTPSTEIQTFVQLQFFVGWKWSAMTHPLHLQKST